MQRQRQRQRRLVERLDWAITDYARCLLRRAAPIARGKRILPELGAEMPGVSAKDISHPPPFCEKVSLRQYLMREIQLALSMRIIIVA